MTFPSNRVAKIPDNPAQELRLSWMNNEERPFLEWIQTGLATVSYDIETLKFQALIRFKADGLLVSHKNAPAQRWPVTEKYESIGPIEVRANYLSGVTPNPDIIRRMNQIVNATRKDADKLFATLLDCTYTLYGTRMPHKGWQALLRAGARGWAIT
jgi:hypothetical protein